MKKLFDNPWFLPWAAIMSPIVVYLLYKVGLELWCIAYGLIY